MDAVYDPTDYCFEWTPPEDPTNPFDVGWYKWDSVKAHEEAKAARDAHYNEMKKKGRKVKRSQMRNQLITRGGIGSEHPQVEFLVTIYRLIFLD
jgi:hypothetical protein